MTMTDSIVKQHIRDKALALGFHAIGFAPATLGPEARTRLAAFLAVADVAPNRSYAIVVANALAKGAIDKDRWLPDAATAAAARRLPVATEPVNEMPDTSG